MFHYEHVLFPQVAESTPARLSLGEGVALHPPPAGVVVEVAAWVHRLIQASHDHAGHGDARLAQTQPWVTYETEGGASLAFRGRKRALRWRVLRIRLDPVGPSLHRPGSSTSATFLHSHGNWLQCERFILCVASESFFRTSRATLRPSCKQTLGQTQA